MDKDQIIAEQLTTLPDNIRELIATGLWAKTTESIADQYYLDAEQKTKLKNEVMLAIIGLEDTRELTKNITDNVGLNTDLAEEITSSISRQVLGPLVDAWEEAAANAPAPVDPLTEAKAKFAKIASKGRFPADLLIKRFEMLPKNVQSLVIGNEIAKIISPLAAKYDLHIDQSGMLAETSILVMLGLVKTTDFISELERSLGLTKIKAGDLAYEVDQKLFKPIREDLKRVAEVKSAEPTATSASSSNSTTSGPSTTNPDANIIHPHPAQRAYYGSVPLNVVAPSTQPTPTQPKLDTPAPTQPSTITEQKLNTVVTAPKQDVTVQRTIDPYREPIN